jgi:hypothetical protein
MVIQSGVMKMILGQDIPFVYPNRECTQYKHAKLVFCTLAFCMLNALIDFTNAMSNLQSIMVALIVNGSNAKVKKLLGLQGMQECVLKKAHDLKQDVPY